MNRLCHKIIMLLIFLFTTGILTFHSLYAQEYIIIDLGMLEGPECDGTPYTEAWDINSKGEIVGVTNCNEHYMFCWKKEQGMVDIELGWDTPVINNHGVVAATLPDGSIFIWAENEGTINLGHLGPDNFGFSTVYDINKHGQVVGKSNTNDSGDERAYLASTDNGLIDLGTLYDVPRSEAWGINKKGQIVGHSDTNIMAPYGVVYQHAFLWTAKDGMVDIGTLGGDSFAVDINKNGKVVGYARTESGDMHGFLWTEEDGMTDITDPHSVHGGLNSWEINDSGQVIGRLIVGSDEHAFFWENNNLIDIGTLNGNGSSNAQAINEKGQVVGSSNGHAFLWQNNQITDLNELLPSGSEWELVKATDINNFGQIIGYGNLDGQRRGFLMTPKP